MENRGSQTSTEQEKKPIYRRWWFIVIAVIIITNIVGAFGVGEEKTDQATETIASKEITEAVNNIEKDIENKEVTTQAKSAPTAIPESEIKSTSVTLTPATSATGRNSTLAILKSNASTKWGDNYQMVKYEYDNQVEAYDWVVAQTKYPDIMNKAKQKWGNNFQMVQYEYNNQVEAYQSL